MEYKNIKYLIAIVLCLLSFGVIGCATGADVAALNDRIIKLEKQNGELQKDSEEMRSQIANYSKKEQNLRTDLGSKVNQFVETEMPNLRGKMEGLEHSLSKTENRLSKIEQYLDLEKPSISGSKSDKPDSDNNSKNNNQDNQDNQDNQNQGNQNSQQNQDSNFNLDDENLSDKDLYNMSKKALDQQDFDNAHRGFHALIKKYPKSNLVVSSKFNIGEIYYKKQQYEKAIIEYDDVIKKYPKSDKVQGCLLKQGLAFFNLKDKKSAKIILQELINKYPKSNEAKIAKQKLNTLK